MGVYLNSTNAYGLFQEEYSRIYFVDKNAPDESSP